MNIQVSTVLVEPGATMIRTGALGKQTVIRGPTYPAPPFRELTHRVKSVLVPGPPKQLAQYLQGKDFPAPKLCCAFATRGQLGKGKKKIFFFVPLWMLKLYMFPIFST